MSSYTQFTQKERTELALMLREDYEYSDMAQILNKDISSISREILRNSERFTGIYHARLAHENAKRRRKNKSIPGQKIRDIELLKNEIKTAIKDYHSPEQIVGALKNKYKNTVISKDTIYAYIDNFAPHLHKYLRFQKNKYRRKKGTKDREKRREEAKKRRIDERPEYIEERKESGHWEGDTVWSKDKQYAIVTLVERVTGYALATIVPNKTSEVVNNAIIDLFSEIPKELLKTLTLDNGSEFAGFETLEKKLNITVYFAYPYHSWERGTNENWKKR